MAVTVSEIHSTSALVIDSESKKITRLFQVIDDDGGDVSVGNVSNLSGVPDIGDNHPSIADLFVQSISISKPNENTKNRAVVEVAYQNEFVQGVEEAFVRYSTKVSSVYLDAFRVGAALPSDLSFPADEDISGTSVDMGGSPISVQATQATVETTFNVESVPNFASLFAATGARNSGTFLGFAAGTLLYLGPTIDRVGANQYQRRDSFVFDSFSHCRQIIGEVDLDGRAVLDEYQRAAKVYWRQPFSNTFNFSSLGIPT